MQIKKGTKRIVSVFNKFVIKLAIIKLKDTFQNVKFLIKNYKNTPKDKRAEAKEKIKKYLKYHYTFDLSVQNLLFSGIMENLNEYKFYKKEKNIFLMPTYFTFFGLFNIQKAGEELTIDYLLLWKQLLNITQDYNQLSVSPHTFSSPSNFCIENGKLKITDYGSKKAQIVLKKYGEKIYNEFVI